MAATFKYTTMKQVGGDDGYQYQVFDKVKGRVHVSGCTKSEGRWYRVRLENTYREQHGEDKIR